MKRKLLYAAVVTALIAAALWLCRDKFFATGDEALVLYGNVDDRQVRMAFQISERIESVAVEEGSRVGKGDLLATLESVRVENLVRSAAAGRDSARARLEELINGSRQEDIAIAKAEVEAIKAKLKAAEADFIRESRLIEVSAISRRDAESAEASCMMYRALLDAAENNLRKLVNGSRPETIAQARAQLAQAETELAIQQQRLRDCRLVAPCDAIVRNRILEPGEMASPQTPVLTLAVVSPKWVRAYLPETLLTRIRSGDRALVRFDGAPETEFAGWVGFISPNAEFTPKNVETQEIRTSLVYEIRIFVNDTDNRLKLGAPATVRFPESPRP